MHNLEVLLVWPVRRWNMAIPPRPSNCCGRWWQNIRIMANCWHSTVRHWSIPGGCLTVSRSSRKPIAGSRRCRRPQCLGDACFEAGLPERAEAAYQALVDLFPDDADALVSLGLVHFHQERVELAALCYRRRWPANRTRSSPGIPR